MAGFSMPVSPEIFKQILEVNDLQDAEQQMLKKACEESLRDLEQSQAHNNPGGGTVTTESSTLKLPLAEAQLHHQATPSRSLSPTAEPVNDFDDAPSSQYHRSRPSSPISDRKASGQPGSSRAPTERSPSPGPAEPPMSSKRAGKQPARFKTDETSFPSLSKDSPNCHVFKHTIGLNPNDPESNRIAIGRIKKQVHDQIEERMNAEFQKLCLFNDSQMDHSASTVNPETSGTYMYDWATGKLEEVPVISSDRGTAHMPDDDGSSAWTKSGGSGFNRPRMQYPPNSNEPFTIRLARAEDEEPAFNDINRGNEEDENHSLIDPGLKHAEKIDILRKRYKNSKYDERFLGTIVNTDVIRGDYTEVHVKPTVIEELERITALTLKHPKEFDYGVLKRNKITGAILYGPPGTGKTILAKALSKHSGYNMMVLTSGDIYDPKWGEDEKFIRSTSRIAQRLHPCIVFIDEADAIFGKRTALDRKHERGMLNQFLSEWDGIATGLHAPFILLATNRPNDIDEAVLRRAPVQILIDIPNRMDRERILEIYLRGESLDSGITAKMLARMTQFYTGSDLKSLCVNAALACLSATIVPDTDKKDPTETGIPQQNGTEGPPADNPNKTSDSSTPDVGIPKRVLKREHFITAMKSIKPTGRGPTALAARRFKQKPM